MSLHSAVLFLVFNRPETSRQVFEVIRQARPQRLYVAADGPRIDHPGENLLCEEARRVATDVDWPCDVITLFREENLGCRIGVSSGIDWFFEHEDEGIILEDDVVPSPDFFGYCEKMLKKFRQDERVMMITGTNFYPSDTSLQSYFFSQHFSIWGWATWKRAWRLYDRGMSDWPSSANVSFLKYHFGTKIANYYIYTFNLITEKKLDTWDIQWVYCCILNSGLCVTPRVNLISNIGIIGTHSNEVTDSHLLKLGILDSDDLHGPDRVCVDVEYDLKLHESKHFPAMRKALLIDFIHAVGMSGPLRQLYRTTIAICDRISR
jgi:hypothetical protein